MSTSEKLALYRQWRPQNFRDVVAQKQVVYPLQQSVRTGRFAHAFLFSGTRGTGKTSVAKVFAKAINCLNPDDGNPCNECEICRAANNGSLMDIQEIDAASNNGVDDVRRLTSEIIFTPVMAKYKVYIIDEAHMLSQQAFNALLKTLEEPPAHAVFILATTEPHRIPATIMSRCQHYEFRRIAVDDIVKRLRRIADDLDLAIADDALNVIAQLANGGMRDAISLLDQVRQIPEEEIDRDAVLQIAGRVPEQVLHTVSSAIFHNNPDALLQAIQELVMSGRDLTRFLIDLSSYMRNLLVCKVSKNPENLIQVTSSSLQKMQDLAAELSAARISSAISDLAKLSSSLRFSPDVRTSMEIALLALAAKNGTAFDVEPANRSERAKQRVKKEKVSQKQMQTTKGSKTFRQSNSPNIGSEISRTVKNKEIEKIAEPDVPETAKEEQSDDSITGNQEAAVYENESEQFEYAEEPAKELSMSQEEEKTLSIWQEVLDQIRSAHLMDLSLMVRPAKVSRNGKLWTLSFDHNLTGQYSCISEPESVATIQKYIAKVVKEPVQLEVKLLEDKVSDAGVTAEEDWMLKLRRMRDK